MVAKVETSIWDRLLEASAEDLTPETANWLLRLRFRQADLDRMNHLAEINRAGAISEEQRAELETYARIGRMVAVMQARARLALDGARGR